MEIKLLLNMKKNFQKLNQIQIKLNFLKMKLIKFQKKIIKI